MPNTSRNKENQTMNFRQLIEYKMRNIFLDKSYTECGGEIILRPFFKKSTLGIKLRICDCVLVFVQIATDIIIKKCSKSFTDLS